MRITLINQTFYPDVASSGQHLADLALRLAERGHEVTVVTGRRAYDTPTTRFPKRETWRGVRIYRVFNTGFGKGAKWKRAVDFASFIWCCWWRLWFLPKPGLIVALTTPPLISFVGAWYARLRGSKFCYWIMDLNPDEALAAGWLRPNSFAARWLERFSRFSLKHAAINIVLDRFMEKRVLEKGIHESRVTVVPPWSHDSEVCFDEAGRGRFRAAHGLEDKFVVMYAGNHSPCHPLDTVLAAANALAGEKAVAFCFVGGGSDFAKVKRFAAEHRLSNVLCLPYQPLDQLAGALSAADLHLVVMGDAFVGVVHPCKIYNILRVGSPVLYIGPDPSHISELLDQIEGRLLCGRVRHGEPARVAESIMKLKQAASDRNRAGGEELAEPFSRDKVLPSLVDILEQQPMEPAANATPKVSKRFGPGSSFSCLASWINTSWPF